MDELKNNFIKFIKNKKYNNMLSSLKPNEFRLATYNVHYFTDLYENVDTFSNILDDIKDINANCIGLQEIILASNEVKINKSLNVDLNNFYKKFIKNGYDKIVVCNSVPSWFKAIYGNMLLIKEGYCPDNVCEDLSETIYTFPKSKTATKVSGKHQGTTETRCYIKINIKYNNYNIIIYNTHLDVALESERVQQINLIINDINTTTNKDDVVFIMGDFNTFDSTDKFSFDWKNNPYTKDNGLVIKTLKNNNFFDCHSQNKSPMTTWNNTRVDFIFCNKKIIGDFRAEYFYTLNSDHIPVVLTLTPNTKFKNFKFNKRNKNTNITYKKTHYINHKKTTRKNNYI